MWYIIVALSGLVLGFIVGGTVFGLLEGISAQRSREAMTEIARRCILDKNNETKPLTFNLFQLVNAKRCAESFPSCKKWTIKEWTLAICGEAGELANFLKKIERGDFSITDPEVNKKMRKELADIITYCDLGMSELGASTQEEVIEKFNEVSLRMAKQGRLPQEQLI